MPQRIEEIFNECLDAILAGNTVEECLRQHPDEAEELRPLLEISASMTRTLASLDPGPALKTSVMLRLDKAIQERHKREQRRPFFYAWQPKLATVVAGVCALLFAGVVSINTSARSQPDDILYPLKLTTEQFRLSLTFSEPAKTELRLQLAETRVNELAYLAGKGDTAAIDSIVRRLESNLGITPEETAKTMASDLPGAPVVNQAPAPRLTAPAPSPTTATTPDITTGKETIKTPLAVSQGKSLAILEEALKTAPESARPAIQQAILRIKRAYEQAASKAADR